MAVQEPGRVVFPGSYAEVVELGGNQAACLNLLVRSRWSAGFLCPLCGEASSTQFHGPVARCLKCRRRVSVTTRTVMHGTKAPLSAWLGAAWLMADPSRGVSARELHQRLDLYSYQTAWTMLHRLRVALGSEASLPKLSDEVSVDETLLGRMQAGVPGRGVLGQRLVAVAVKAGPQGPTAIRFGLLADASPASIRAFLRRYVEPGSVVVTDSWAAYPPACAAQYRHRVVSGPAEATGRWPVAAPGIAHAIHLVNEWLTRTHQASVSVRHLQRYLDEFAFRFDHRDDPPDRRLEAIVRSLVQTV
jgi:hypothetical protein